MLFTCLMIRLSRGSEKQVLITEYLDLECVSLYSVLPHVRSRDTSPDGD